MQRGQLIDARTGTPRVGLVYRTDNAWERLRGLLGRAPLSDGEGLLIDPCGSIHTLFMDYAIDVVYLTRDFHVLRIAPALPPWRLSLAVGARYTLELAIGGAERAGLSAGAALAWQACTP